MSDENIFRYSSNSQLIIFSHMQIFLLFTFFIFLSCTQKVESDAGRFIDIFDKGTDSVFKRDYDKRDRLISTYTKYFTAIYKTNISYNSDVPAKIHGVLLDKMYGHNFDFYDNGGLRTYSYYYGNSNQSSYIRKYSEKGFLIEQKGNPFVDYMRIDGDSLCLFFSTVFVDSLSAYFTVENKKEIQINLKKSDMQPMLSEGNIPFTTHNVFLRMLTIDKQKKYKQNFYDTLYSDNKSK